MARLFITTLSLFCILISPEILQNKSFEGTINYQITYSDLPEEIRQMEGMLPKSLSMTFKGDNMRLDQAGMMGASQVILLNNQTKESHILMDMMGQKLDVFLDKATMEKEEAKREKPVIELVEEYKNILSYKCQKALIKQAGVETEVWFTNKIQAVHAEYKELPGFPLEYLSKQDGMTMKMTASVVDQKDISDSLFEVPEGYMSMTMAELEKMTGGY